MKEIKEYPNLHGIDFRISYKRIYPKDDNEDINNLFKDMDDLIDSVKDY